MQILITDERARQPRTLQLTRWQLGLVTASLLCVLLLFSGAVYHFIFLTAVRDNWPVVSHVVKLVIRDESAQRDRVLRDNLDALSRKVGEMQARMVALEAVSERVSGLAGLKAEDLKALEAGAVSRMGSGGVYLPVERRASVEAIESELEALGLGVDWRADVLTFAESRLFESRLAAAMVPNTRPVDAPTGSGFGIRSDPFTGRPALHTGLDFAADIGTPILAAAGGVVQLSESHPQYGRMLEIDHGNGLVTRYAHTSAIHVKVGEVVRRGQVVAAVGNTGRSTGPHLHFEVLLGGVPQNPARFLATAGRTTLAGVATVPGR